MRSPRWLIAFGIGLLLAAIVAVALAQTIPGGLDPLVACGAFSGTQVPLTTVSYQSLQVGRAAASGLTVPTSTTVRQVVWAALITTATAPSTQYGINWRDDGTNPTATLGTGGMTLTGQTLLVCSAQLSKVKFIGNGTSDVVLGITYYGF